MQRSSLNGSALSCSVRVWVFSNAQTSFFFLSFFSKSATEKHDFVPKPSNCSGTGSIWINHEQAPGNAWEPSNLIGLQRVPQAQKHLSPSPAVFCFHREREAGGGAALFTHTCTLPHYVSLSLSPLAFFLCVKSSEECEMPTEKVGCEIRVWGDFLLTCFRV